MPYDQLLRDALEHAVAGVRGPLDVSIRALGDELRRRAAAEHEEAERRAAESAAALRQQAEAQLAALQKATDERIATARQDAQREMEEAQRAFENERARAAEAVQAETAGIQQRADAAIAEIRQQAAAEAAELRARTQAEIEDARRAAQAEVSSLQRALDERTAESRREIEGLHREMEDARRLLESSRNASDDLRRQLEAVRGEMEQLRARLADEHQDVALLHGIRSIDEARTLGEVLDRVVQVRRTERERVAVFVLKGGQLQQWRSLGFESEGGGSVDAQLGNGIVSDVLRRGVPSMRSAEEPAAAAAGAEPRDTAAFPITIGGAVVAVLYADSPADVGAEAGRWRAVLEVLSRHASRVLEAITIQRAAGLLPPAGSAPRVAATGGSPR